MPTYYNLEDAIEGERIACQFRSISKPRLISGTRTHRAQKAALGDAYCVITKPLRFKRT
jgi:hypothetical protein